MVLIHLNLQQQSALLYFVNKFEDKMQFLKT